MAPRARPASPNEAAPESDRYADTPHPRETSALFGHAEAEAELLQTYRSGRLPQAFIIGGAPGIGKATLAWRLARFLLAYPEPTSAAGQSASDLFVPEDHPVARQVAALAHPDLLLLRRAWNEKTKKHFTDIRVDDVRRATHMFQQAAGRGGYRICILDSAEDLNIAGANALLKLIEEPPPRSLFLIVAQRPNQVLATIRSRCGKIALRPLDASNVAGVIAALGSPWSRAEETELQAALARGQGSVHDVLRLLRGGGVDLDAKLRRMLDKLPLIDWRQVHALADGVAPRDNSDDYAMLLVSVLDWLDEKMRRESQAGAAGLVRRLAPYAEVWEKLAEAARETETLNLDRRPVVFAIFADLAAAAARASSS